MKTLKFTYADGTTREMPLDCYDSPFHSGGVTNVEIAENEPETFAVECFKKTGWVTPVIYFKLEEITLDFFKKTFACGYWQIKITRPNKYDTFKR